MKTKSLNEYLKKRLDKSEIKKMNLQAQKEIEQQLKYHFEKMNCKHQVILHLITENYDLAVFELNKLLQFNGQGIEFVLDDADKITVDGKKNK